MSNKFSQMFYQPSNILIWLHMHTSTLLLTSFTLATCISMALSRISPYKEPRSSSRRTFLKTNKRVGQAYNYHSHSIEQSKFYTLP